jgi:hypothetical protein
LALGKKLGKEIFLLPQKAKANLHLKQIKASSASL